MYLSSVTDPYLPAERSLRLTRGILEALLEHQPRLLIQTRGPLVTRDIDILRQFRRVRVNISIPTDSEEVRRAFEPKAPLLENRWQVIEKVRAAGISIGICVTPLLPLARPEAFIDRVISAHPDVLVVQEFHDSKGGFGADTRPAARQLLAKSNWSPTDYQTVVYELRRRRQVFEGESGFFPP